MRKISIGILAHNEAKRLDKSLMSLFRQDLFTAGEDEVEIVVVPNGCTDATASVARRALSERRFTKKVTWQVCDVAEAGKSRAWNLFVHELANKDADYLILMDADIELLGTSTLSNMVTALEHDPHAQVAVDTAIKDFLLRGERGVMERMSAAVSKSCNDERVWICGQLYCGRGPMLRRVHLPIGLPVEDGFLWSMVARDCFTTQADARRIIRSHGAAHTFSAYVAPWQLVRHEQRIILGMTINTLLVRHFIEASTKERHAGELIREANLRDPAWLAGFIRDAVKREGAWVVPGEWLFRRFAGLKYVRAVERIAISPALVAAFLVDLGVFLAANRKLQRGQGAGVW